MLSFDLEWLQNRSFVLLGRHGQVCDIDSQLFQSRLNIRKLEEDRAIRYALVVEH